MPEAQPAAAEPLGGRRRSVPGMVPREELLVPLALRQALGEPVSLAFPSLQGPADKTDS